MVTDPPFANSATWQNSTIYNPTLKISLTYELLMNLEVLTCWLMEELEISEIQHLLWSSYKINQLITVVFIEQPKLHRVC